MSEARAMAEQAILKILWPPDGKFSWEDRFKVADVERALKNLLDAVEKEPVQPNPAGNEAISQKMADLKALGYSETQIARQMGYTPNAVHKRLDGLKKRMQKQTANSPGVPVAEEAHSSPGGIQQDVKTDTAEPVRTGSEIPFSCHHENGRVDPAALRSAAPDQFVEANKMIADADPTESKPPADDATLRNIERVEQGQEVEQVSGRANLQDAKPERSGKPQDLEQKQIPKPEKVPLTDEQKAEIWELHEKGLKNCEIADRLGIRNMSQIQGIIVGRKRKESAYAVQPSDTSAKPTRDVMLLQQSTEGLQAKREPAQDTKPLTNEERRQTLLDMKIERLSYTNTVAQIAEKLSVPGDVWTEDMVDKRLQKVRGKA